jgi:hypothetical protein
MACSGRARGGRTAAGAGAGADQTGQIAHRPADIVASII